MRFTKQSVGPSSYSTGGFLLPIGQFEKVQHASVMMDPETALGGAYITGINVDTSTYNVRVLLGRIFSDSLETSWAELSANTDVSAINFIMSGDAI